MARPALSPLNEPPAWADAYVGLPWKNGGRARDGLDCWGLARLVAAERFGKELPVYQDVVWTPCKTRGDQAAANADLAAYMNGEKLKGWEIVWEASASPAVEPLGGGRTEPGDLIMIRNVGAAIHFGIAVAPGWMLHIEDGVDAMCVPYDDARTERRVVGFYRWVGERC